MQSVLNTCAVQVPSLRLLAAHTLVKNTAAATENMTEEAIHRYYGTTTTVMASIKVDIPSLLTTILDIKTKRLYVGLYFVYFILLQSAASEEEKLFKLSDFPSHEKLEKFMEDVKFGIYPLTAFSLSEPAPTARPAQQPESEKVCTELSTVLYVKTVLYRLRAGQESRSRWMWRTGGY